MNTSIDAIIKKYDAAESKVKEAERQAKEIIAKAHEGLDEAKAELAKALRPINRKLDLKRPDKATGGDGTPTEIKANSNLHEVLASLADGQERDQKYIAKESGVPTKNGVLSQTITKLIASGFVTRDKPQGGKGTKHKITDTGLAEFKNLQEQMG